MKINALQRQAGLNLIEVLVAALILSVGLLSMAGLQVASLRSVQNATQKQQAAFMIYELLERMRSNREAALAGNYTVALSCSSAPRSNCSGNTSCSPAQLAVYDIYTVQCGDGNASVTRAGVDNQLLEGRLQVACPSGCDNGVRVNMSWYERLSSGSGTTGATNEPDTKAAQVFTLSVDAII